MKVVLAGGSGFLGRALTASLTNDGHQVFVLSRGKPGPAEAAGVCFVDWSPNGTVGGWARAIQGADAVINLAGAGIADKRWTPARKQLLRDSRVLSTRSLAEAIRTGAIQPSVFIQGSGIGYYGAFDDGPALTEDSPAGSDLLGHICAAWENETTPIADSGCRLVILRTGIVLSKSGGALAKMLTPFRFFVGGRLGSGRQVISWIHVDDWVAMVRWALDDSHVSGPINATTPNPVTNAEFSRAIGRAIRRPSWAPVPGFVLRIIVGEFANDGLLRGQRVLPVRAQALGFRFRYDRIDEAMRAAVAAPGR